jgi:hypothetical protein
VYLSHISITCCLVETTLACLASISFYMPHHYCIYRHTYIHTHTHTHTHTHASTYVSISMSISTHEYIYYQSRPDNAQTCPSALQRLPGYCCGSADEARQLAHELHVYIYTCICTITCIYLYTYTYVYIFI